MTLNDPERRNGRYFACLTEFVSFLANSANAVVIRPTEAQPRAVASPGYVARRGKAGNYVMGHSRRTLGPGAADAR